MTITPHRVFFACFLAWSAIAVGACGDSFESESSADTCPADPNVPCNEDPWNCDDGQTCWFDESGLAMTCLNAGPAVEGLPCSPAVGSPACGEGLLCVALNGEDMGVCRRFCDVTPTCKACPNDYPCRNIIFNNPNTGDEVAATRVCTPP